MPVFKLPAVKDDANPQLNGSISGADTSIALKSGHGAKLPTIYRGTATSGGDQVTLNSTGIGSSGVAVGDFIENETDGSVAVIRTVNTNSIVTTPLRGGSGNTWDNSDAWSVNRFHLRFIQRDASNNIIKKEKVLVTNRSTDTLTVVRAQDGDSAQSFDADDYCEIVVLKVHIDEMQKAIRELILTIDEMDRGTHDYVASTNSGNAYTVNLSPKYTTLADITGKIIVWKASAANTGAATLNLNGTGAVAIKKEQGLTDVASADIANNAIIITSYNGTEHIMLNAVANAPASADLTMESKSANYTVLSSESNKVFVQTTNPVVFTLPSPTAGKHYGFLNKTGHYMYLKSSAIAYDSLTSQYFVQNGYGDGSTELAAIDGTNYMPMYLRGTWYLWNGKGYICGGTTHASFNNASTNVIDNLNFADETSVAIGGTTAVTLGQQTPVSSSLKGYMLGGYTTTGTATASAACEALTYSAETCAALAATLDTARGAGAGVSSTESGFCLGGYGTSTRNIISKLTFSSEAEASIAATLDTAKQAASGASFALKGYCLGGYVASAVNVIENIVYASETSAAIGGTLATSVYDAAYLNNPFHAFLGGANATVTTIQKFTLASETTSNLAATLGTGRALAAGISAMKGYFCGGGNMSSTVYSAIDDMNFSDDTSVTIAATLDTARRSACGLTAR